MGEVGGGAETGIGDDAVLHEWEGWGWGWLIVLGGDRVLGG